MTADFRIYIIPLLVSWITLISGIIVSLISACCNDSLIACATSEVISINGSRWELTQNRTSI